MSKQTTYKDAGVDVDLGDEVSSMLYEAAKQTWKNREGRLGTVITPFDDFTGVRGIDVSGLPSGTMMNLGFDGVGTKTEIAERVGNHSTIAHDLLAMVCDDAVIRGAEPVLVGSILDAKTLSEENGAFHEEIKQLAQGYIEAANQANIAVVNGEIAELGARIGGHGPFNYNWGASVAWFANQDRLITGKAIEPGDYLVGFQENGFRSNGLSLVRKIASQHFGDEWHQTPYRDLVSKRGDQDHDDNWHEAAYKEGSLGSAVLTPSQIYTKAAVALFGGVKEEPRATVHGMAHITGGGLPGKLERMLRPSGYGATINSPIHPPTIMQGMQTLGNVTDEEAYRTWNMGHGMVIATPEPEQVLFAAKDHRIDANVIGEVTQDPTIQIKNRGAHSKSDEYLIFRE